MAFLHAAKKIIIVKKGKGKYMAIVVPELFSDAVNAKMDVSLRVGRIAFDATELVPDIRECGDQVSFPTIDRISGAEVMVKGNELTPSELSMTNNVAAIKQVGKAVRVYDKDSKQVKGQVIDSMSEQIGEEMAKAVDGDLIDEMDKNAVYKTSTANAVSVTMEEIESGFDAFGDAVDDDLFAGIIINSRLRKDFLSMDGFVKTDYTNINPENGKMINGCIGYFHGIIPVIISNNKTFDTDTSECKTYIVKKNALGIVWQKEADVEEERESLKKATLLSSDEMYAVKLLDTKGVSVLRKTVS